MIINPKHRQFDIIYLMSHIRETATQDLSASF